MLYGNYIRPPPRRRISLSRFQGITYGLRAKGCYTDTQGGLESYAETIYTSLGEIAMTRTILAIGTLLTITLLPGCGKQEAGPRFQGRIVSHVDGHGSGTGTESALLREGTMTSGFDYGDSTKPDWTSDIKWCFLRQDGESDVYRVEWTFRPKNGTGGAQTMEVSFDGKQIARVCGNQWQTISIEPESAEADSQPAAATDG